ncbi:MAG: ABC transporter permease [Acholeplasmataceae bacterium]|nr:ABC transporter permease [Acholeplasmataceae bacterium]
MNKENKLSFAKNWLSKVIEFIKYLWSNHSYIVVFLIIFVISVVVNPNFAKWNSIMNIFKQSAIVGVIALGMSLIIITGKIDLSVGATLAFVSGISIVILNSTGSILLTVIFALVFGTVLGLINGVLVERFRMEAFIATLATMLIFRAVVTYLARENLGAQYIVGDEVFQTYRQIASGNLFGVPYLAIYFLLLGGLMVFITTQTKLGKYFFAVGSNEKAAALAGINVKKVRIIAYAITGTLVGVSAILYTSRLTAIQPSSAALGMELDAIAACVIGGIAMSGGRGKLLGTIFGVLIFQIISTFVVFAGIPPLLVDVVKGFVIIFAVLSQRNGR